MNREPQLDTGVFMLGECDISEDDFPYGRHRLCNVWDSIFEAVDVGEDAIRQAQANL